MAKLGNFIRAFMRNDGPKPVRHSGHDLARNVRDAVGAARGGGSGGGAGSTGGATEAILKQASKGKQRRTE